MGIIIASFKNNSSFENKENLKRTAKMILTKQGASAEATEKILEKTIFSNNVTLNNYNADILRASYQISQNLYLKETLKQIKNTNNKNKKHTLGEIWELKKENNSTEYDGELKDFEVDLTSNNFFIAA